MALLKTQILLSTLLPTQFVQQANISQTLITQEKLAFLGELPNNFLPGITLTEPD